MNNDSLTALKFDRLSQFIYRCNNAMKFSPMKFPEGETKVDIVKAMEIANQLIHSSDIISIKVPLTNGKEW